MPVSQNREVTPPLPDDKDLKDFSEIVQGNFRDIFQDAHIHYIKTAAPANADGQIGDILIVQVSSTWYLYAKVAANTWKRVALS